MSTISPLPASLSVCRSLQSVLADRRKPEMTELSAGIGGFADAVLGAPCHAGKNQSAANNQQGCAESRELFHSRFLSALRHRHGHPSHTMVRRESPIAAFACACSDWTLCVKLDDRKGCLTVNQTWLVTAFFFAFFCSSRCADRSVRRRVSLEQGGVTNALPIRVGSAMRTTRIILKRLLWLTTCR